MMQMKIAANKNVFNFLFFSTLVIIVFLIGNLFYAKLQTIAIMEYSPLNSKSYVYYDIKYELPENFICDIEETDKTYKNSFIDDRDDMYGSIEIFTGEKNIDDLINKESGSFQRSNIEINGINYILLENKLISKDNLLTRNFIYYTLQNERIVKFTFSSNNKNIKENITIFFEDIISKFKFL